MSKSDLRSHCYAMGYSDGEVSAFYDGIEKGRADAIDEFAEALPNEFCNYCNQIACDGGRIGSIQECASVTMLVDVMKDLAEELKEQKE